MEADKAIQDRIGLGWRPELAAGILANLDRIDLVEAMIDDFLDASTRELRPLRTLAAQVPVVLHGVSLGLASSVAVDSSLLERFARVVNSIRPSFWSEHLAFVRGGGLEIGHLAAPPRTDATVAGTAANLRRARAVVGTAPLVENVATLIEPPGSVHDEAKWISFVLSASDGSMLLDLNNLHTNATNFSYDPLTLLDQIPFERVDAIHLAGGKWISGSSGERRLLDDHLHDVPDVVYELLAEVGVRAARPLTVIMERDGAFPPIDHLLAQLDRARQALAFGRRVREQSAA